MTGGILPASDPDTSAPGGVQALDHTADVGIQVEAPNLEELFRRAGMGSLWMAVGATEDVDRTSPLTDRTVELDGDDLPELLRSWCRELLYWQEVEGLLAVEIPHLELEGSASGGVALTARVRHGPSPEHPVREIKGVTWHGLQVEERAGQWHARIIFDV